VCTGMFGTSLLLLVLLLLVLLQRKYHELFIHNGGLGVLKAWLEPYKDGSLPNTKIRTMVLNCCKVGG
jgi:transcription factor SPN1